MTGKERAGFRSQANTLVPLFQVGKGGISDSFFQQVDGALNTRELIKIKVLLDTSPISAREAADKLAEKTNAEVIQVIGGVIVLYRKNPELHKAVKKPKKKPVKRFSPFEKKVHVKTRKEHKDELQRKKAGARKKAK